MDGTDLLLDEQNLLSMRIKIETKTKTNRVQ